MANKLIKTLLNNIFCAKLEWLIIASITIKNTCMSCKVAILNIMGFLVMVSCMSKEEIIQPEVKNISESVYASGFIKSINQYEVFSKTSGIIEEVYVTDGSLVEKGDPIFKLNQKDLKLATENAREAFLTADYKTNADKLQDANKAIDLAIKRRSNDSLLYERQKNLWKNAIGSRVELEQKELNFENAKISMANAQTNYNDLKRQLKLISNQSKNNFEIAKIVENDLIIRSELNGVVYKINKEKGELISSQESQAIIGSDKFIIELTVDEFDVLKIKKGQEVIIAMDSYKSEVFTAEIMSIDPMMNTRTRSFQAKAIFTNPPEVLYPNLTVEANIIIDKKEAVLTIPRNYMVNDTMVMLEGGKLQKVATGLMDYDVVEITNGISKTTKLQLPKE